MTSPSSGSDPNRVPRMSEMIYWIVRTYENLRPGSDRIILLTFSAMLLTVPVACIVLVAWLTVAYYQITWNIIEKVMKAYVAVLRPGQAADTAEYIGSIATSVFGTLVLALMILTGLAFFGALRRAFRK